MSDETAPLVAAKRPRGRPPKPPGTGKTARIEWRTTDALKARAEALAAASGLSVSQWLDRAVERARMPTAPQAPGEG